MKELRETQFKKKSNDLEKAMSYAEKLLKNKYYHSNVIFEKLNNRYTWKVRDQALKILKEKGCLNDTQYIEKFKDLCKKKMYGINRFKLLLSTKGIRVTSGDVYTYDEEKTVLDELILVSKRKYSKLDSDKFAAKLKYLVNYKGFTGLNISNIDRKEL